MGIGMYIASQIEKSIDSNVQQHELIKNMKDFDQREQRMLKRSEEERRMDIIGQNGNDGLHYDKLDATDWDDGEGDDD
tara:strand:+ start:4223 stop:4456 length:234 start_codon:yes stop_codon:yes gene_type:complete